MHVVVVPQVGVGPDKRDSRNVAPFSLGSGLASRHRPVVTSLGIIIRDPGETKWLASN
jgi:hypothetical protein